MSTEQPASESTSLPRALAAFLQLALLSFERRQQLPGHKFLILAATVARETGFKEAAEQCRNHVVTANPLHLLSHWPSFTVAFETPEFGRYRQQLQRFCTVERAEHLAVLQGLNVEQATEKDLQHWLARLAQFTV